MTRLAVVLTALLAVLFTTPAAAIAASFNFVVDVNTDSATVPADGFCDDPGTGAVDCTLREAIIEANALGGADIITFAATGQAPAPVAALPVVTEALTIDGGGNTTVTFAGTATGTLLDLNAPTVLVKRITLTGGGTGTMVNLRGATNRLDTVTVRDTPATGVRLTANGARVDGSRVSNADATGILVSGASTTIANTTVTGSGPRGIDVVGGSATIVSPQVSGSSGDGIRLASAGASVTGGHVHNNAGDGIRNEGQNNTISRVVLNANGGKPFANVGGANGGITPPQNLRIGPRRADGTLPLTGSANTGTLELWAGDPASAGAPGYVDGFSVSGDFTYNFATEPAPGSIFSASVNGNGLGSSEFASVVVPSDVRSPDANFARALDTATVRVDFSEPLDAGSVQPEDFRLSMAGLDRQVTAATVSEDGRFVSLSSSGWRAGEAGVVELTGAGAVNDAAGNAILTAPRLRVAAAPGDFVAPLASKLAVTRSVCLTRGRRCRKPGMIIKFVTTEPGKARMLIKRSNKDVGSRVYSNIVAGVNTLKFNGRLGARKLRAGRYRLLIYVQDAVGNVTDQPPIQLFNVRRVTK